MPEEPHHENGDDACVCSADAAADAVNRAACAGIRHGPPIGTPRPGGLFIRTRARYDGGGR